MQISNRPLISDSAASPYVARSASSSERVQQKNGTIRPPDIVLLVKVKISITIFRFMSISIFIISIIFAPSLRMGRQRRLKAKHHNSRIPVMLSQGLVISTNMLAQVVVTLNKVVASILTRSRVLSGLFHICMHMYMIVGHPSGRLYASKHVYTNVHKYVCPSVFASP